VLVVKNKLKSSAKKRPKTVYRVCVGTKLGSSLFPTAAVLSRAGVLAGALGTCVWLDRSCPTRCLVLFMQTLNFYSIVPHEHPVALFLTLVAESQLC